MGVLCQQLSLLDKSVGDDLAMLVIVWKELMKISSLFPESFRSAVDVGEVGKSLVHAISLINFRSSTPLSAMSAMARHKLSLF